MELFKTILLYASIFLGILFIVGYLLEMVRPKGREPRVWGRKSMPPQAYETPEEYLCHHKKIDMNYAKDIIPIAQQLCELDGGEAEANFGQALELIKRMAQIEKLMPGSLDILKEYSETVDTPVIDKTNEQ